MRALFRPFALHAAYTPIETIVFFSIIGTLAYFHILNAIKQSTHTVRPAHAVYRRGIGEWVGVRESVWMGSGKKVDVVPVVGGEVKEFGRICFRPREQCFEHNNVVGIKGGMMVENGWVREAIGSMLNRAKKADWLDVLLIGVGYILMHTTFYLLLSRSRALGSSFFLPLAIVSSAVLALLIALPIAMSLKIPIDPVALIEALPFLVCTVGFDKPLRLARAVFHHPHLTIPPAYLNTLSDPSGYPIRPSTLVPPDASIASAQLKPAPSIITESLSHVYKPIIRDYVLEIAVLTVGAYSRVGGLREVCALAALILAVDCLLICTYLAAILGVMVEVRRIDNLRQMSKSQSASLSLWNRLKSFILGEKRSKLGQVVVKKGKVKIFGLVDVPKTQNPVARLKLLLIATFLTLHILNFITPLTPSKHAYSSPYSFLIDGPSSRKIVDISSPSIRSALNALADATAHDDKDLYVRVSPPRYHRDIRPEFSLSNFFSSSLLSSSSKTTTTTTSRIIELISDPIFSKTILLMLALSISLNGYLLRGIAAGFVGSAAGFGDASQGTQLKDEETVTEVPVPRPIEVPRPVLKLDISPSQEDQTPSTTRTLEECINIFENGPRPLSVCLSLLSDEEIILLAQNGKISPYALEKLLGMGRDQMERAVRIRRVLISRASQTKTLETSDIPLKDYDYTRVYGACCENVIGYIPLPLGIAGPLSIDGQLHLIPMATAEGTLVASTARGCKALNAGGGVTTVLTRDGMTRGPAVDFPSIKEAAEAKAWVESEEGHQVIKQAFESTSRFAKLVGVKCALGGRTLYVRFVSATGDAMGMNMISKGTEKALEAMQAFFPSMHVLALSGNYCTDKKAACINWIEGRGKSIVAEAVVPGSIVRQVLKTTVKALVNLNLKKNLIGSAMAGSVGGGFNAHAANILTAIFLATGQDPAQNVESSQCLTIMEAIPSQGRGGDDNEDDEDLLITISMPCIEVGTIGGGTGLGPQQSVLDMLGLKGAHRTQPGKNAQQLARIIGGAVMAGELSLMSALAAGDLIKAHMRHNRSSAAAVVSNAVPAAAAAARIEKMKEEAVVVHPLPPPSVVPLTPASSRDSYSSRLK